MTNTIRFEREEKLYILNDFKEDVLKSISDKMLKINKDTGSNKFNFYSIEEFISLSSLKDDVKEKLKAVNHNIEFINLQIDSEIHDINKERVMSRNPLESFKALYLYTRLVSKLYNIENEDGDIIKLEGIANEINLKEIHFKYDRR